MVTKTQAMTARHFEHVTAKNADGTPVRCRANGACKTWKRDTTRFSLPVKYGLDHAFRIDNENAKDWRVAP